MNILNYIIPVELIIFGFDGVMVDTTKLFKNFLLNIFQSNSKAKIPANCFSDCNRQQLCYVLRNKYKLPYTEEEFQEILNKYYNDAYNNSTTIDSCFMQYSQYLRDIFIKQAICTTNSFSNLKKVFDNEENNKYLGWYNDYYEIIADNATKDTYGDKLKYIADNLNIPYSNCMVIDDHKAMLTAATDLKMRACAIRSSTSDYTKNDIETMGIMSIKSFSELLVKRN